MLSGGRSLHQEEPEHLHAEHEHADLCTLIAQNAMEGIVLEDNRGCFSFANPAAAHLLGYDSPDELVGQHWRAITPPDMWPVIEAANERRAPRQGGTLRGGLAAP